jgi:hypothetical protein
LSQISSSLLHALDVFHVRAGDLQLLLEVVVEALQQIGPLLLALFHRIQFALELRRVPRSKMYGKFFTSSPVTTVPISVGTNFCWIFFT